ncbi:MAG TPA: hypothetical protein PLY91_09375 [Methanoregulaceae archaeon]|nr:hypothetical protein [Methanoregulaceae archaeon]
MHEGRLIHWARLETGEATTGTADEYGYYTTETTYASTKCLFANGGGAKVLGSGEYVSDVPRAIFPVSAVLTEGMRLVGVSAGWTREYVVRKVRTVWNRVAVDHIEADLEAV